MDCELLRTAVRYLTEKDPLLGGLINKYGEPARRIDGKRSGSELFATLCESIISQQLSTKAAAAISRRVRQHFGGLLTPTQLMQVSPEELRSLGLSAQKARYLGDLASRASDPELLDVEALPNLDDRAVINALVQVKGIGVWTAQMFLIFGLGRPDVWAVDDLGLRRAVQNLFSLPHAPNREEMEAYGRRWRPYRSVASLYLWESLGNRPRLGG